MAGQAMLQIAVVGGGTGSVAATHELVQLQPCMRPTQSES